LTGKSRKAKGERGAKHSKNGNALPLRIEEECGWMIYV